MKSVCEIASRLDARRASLRWIEQIERAAQAYLDANSTREGAAYLEHALQSACGARMAIEQGKADGAVLFALAALQAAWQAEIAEGRVMLEAGVTSYRERERINAEKRATIDTERAEWQKAAAEIWCGNGRLSIAEVARRIDPRRWQTVRKHIRK